MKTFIWSLTVAFGIFCLTAFSVLDAVISDVSQHGKKLPAISALAFQWRLCLLLFPLPFMVYASIFSCRKELSIISALRFAGLLALLGSMIVPFVVMAVLAPYVWLTL